MLEPVPQRRWNIGQVSQHTWIKSFRDVGNSALPPLDEKIKGKIIEKCFADHKIPIMEIHKQLREYPHGPIGGVFNIEKFLYQSSEANNRAIKVSQSHLNKLIRGTEVGIIAIANIKKNLSINWIRAFALACLSRIDSHTNLNKNKYSPAACGHH